MIKKGQVSVVNINPSDLIEKDANLSLQIKNLQMRKVAVGNIGPTFDHQATFKFTDKTDHYDYRPS